jgi:5,10-methylene-tetrahydrofolate dehydrogenase/methenyl tetrahydrofolate cyclohydrolase
MSGQNTITVRGAVALGIGSMVGAGIFALLLEFCDHLVNICHANLVAGELVFTLQPGV